MVAPTTQTGFAYRFDWGAEGLAAQAEGAAVVVIVDVLRFSTAVCCALESGGEILPYRWTVTAADVDDAAAFAREQGATIAGRREDGLPSLSPTDLLSSYRGVRMVLPSPNGATLSLRARDLGVAHTLAGCLRNATATAAAARRLAGAKPIAVIACGERWSDGPLRPSVEDLVGAGAILFALDPSASLSTPRCSPEAAAARAAFVAARPLLYECLIDSVSGRELDGRGWSDDVATSSAYDVSDTVCELVGDAFTARV